MHRAKNTRTQQHELFKKLIKEKITDQIHFDHFKISFLTLKPSLKLYSMNRAKNINSQDLAFVTKTLFFLTNKRHLDDYKINFSIKPLQIACIGQKTETNGTSGQRLINKHKTTFANKRRKCKQTKNSQLGFIGVGNQEFAKKCVDSREQSAILYYILVSRSDQKVSSSSFDKTVSLLLTCLRI